MYSKAKPLNRVIQIARRTLSDNTRTQFEKSNEMEVQRLTKTDMRAKRTLACQRNEREKLGRRLALPKTHFISETRGFTEQTVSYYNRYRSALQRVVSTDQNATRKGTVLHRDTTQRFKRGNFRRNPP